jgi:hypothetical protein
MRNQIGREMNFKEKAERSGYCPNLVRTPPAVRFIRTTDHSLALSQRSSPLPLSLLQTIMIDLICSSSILAWPRSNKARNLLRLNRKLLSEQPCLFHWIFGFFEFDFFLGSINSYLFLLDLGLIEPPNMPGLHTPLAEIFKNHG